MSFDYKKLSPGKLIADSNTTVVTNGSGKTFIKTIIMHNSGGADTVVKLNDVLSGVAEDTVSIFYNDTIEAGSTVFLELPYPGIILDATGDKLTAIADLTNMVNVRVYGGEE